MTYVNIKGWTIEIEDLKWAISKMPTQPPDTVVSDEYLDKMFAILHFFGRRIAPALEA